MMLSADKIFQTGDLLCEGRFRIERQYAAPESPALYVAVDQPSGQRRVIEWVAGEGTKSERRLKPLRHPGVLAVSEVLPCDDGHCLVSEPFEGESLAELIGRKGVFDQPSARALLPRLLSAVEFLHNHDLIHTAITPFNILVDSAGELKLSGLGHSIRPGVPDMRPPLFVFCWSAPELSLGNADQVGAWTDYYGLGATLYYMLSAAVPPSPVDVTTMGYEAFRLDEDVSDLMRATIIHLLQPMPGNRPRALAQICQALRVRLPQYELEQAETKKSFSMYSQFSFSAEAVKSSGYEAEEDTKEVVMQETELLPDDAEAEEAELIVPLWTA